MLPGSPEIAVTAGARLLLIDAHQFVEHQPQRFVDVARAAIEQQIPNSRATADGGGGHFSIEVTSPVFAGMSKLESQRLVYGAIAHLMRGNAPPVHAVDSLKIRTPAAS